MVNDTPTPVKTQRRALSLRAKLVIGFTLLSATVSALTARGIYLNLQSQLLRGFQDQALTTAKMVALQQNGNELSQIASVDDPRYATLLAQFTKLPTSNTDILRVYALRREDTGFSYIVDTSGNSILGATFTPTDTFTANTATLSEGVVEPAIITESNQTYLTAYAPIKNSNNELVGVLGVDVSANSIASQQDAIVSQSILVIIFALIPGLFFGYVAGNTLTEPIVKLTAGAKGFATGDLSQRIEIVTGDEVEELAATFNSMASELQSSISGLEKRVADRTSDLEFRTQELETANIRIQRRAAQFEALAQVTQSITAIRDLNELLPRVTRVISEKFGFYHVGIFLLDEISEFAVLSAANSIGGQRMLERKHRLRVGAEGIVGNVAQNAKPRIAMDVGTDATFFNNPDLPDTHSEMGLPLISKNIIVGVLDVQSIEIGAFSDEDVQMLSLLADQVSLAIENARLFDETRRALAESELITRRTMREAWSRLPEKIKLRGYRYNITGATPLNEPIKLPRPVAEEQQPGETGAGRTVVPIAIRGEVLGSLIVQAPTDAPWNPDQLDIIRAVAERVALAAENARLFDETTSRAERERLVAEITSKIRSHNDPQAMIQTAMDELRTALGASRVEIAPQNKSNENKQVKP